MPHQVNICGGNGGLCRRTIHWPKNARIGHRWRCNYCGTVSRLVSAHTPGADGSGLTINSLPSKHRSSGRYRPSRNRSRAPRYRESNANPVADALQRAGNQQASNSDGADEAGMAILAVGVAAVLLFVGVPLFL